MSEPFSREKLLGALAKAGVVGDVKSDAALTEVALDIETRYKRKLGEGGTHRYGTPTPARPGGPPGLISGQLRRSATHSKRTTGEGLEIRIGPASTPRAPYGSRQVGTTRSGRPITRKLGNPAGGKATNGQVGKYLETGLRNGAKYPALLPAFKEGIAASTVTFRRVFVGGW